MIFDPSTVYTRQRFHRRDGDERVVSPNERAVLNQLWITPGLSRSELGRSLDLTQQSMHRIVARLEARQALRVGALSHLPKKGKPSPQLFLNAKFAGSIGVALNTDTVSVAGSDFAGRMQVDTFDIEGLTMSQVLETVEDRTVTILASLGIRRRDVIGLGFALAGFRVSATQFNAPEPLRDWSLVDLGPILSRHFNLPVWTENGANAGTLCEQMYGVGQGCQNFAYLSFNYGFGGGHCFRGQPADGGFGNAGEFSGMFSPQEAEDRPPLAQPDRHAPGQWSRRHVRPRVDQQVRFKLARR